MTKQEEYELCDVPQTLDEVIQKAAKMLPDGYNVRIDIELNGYNVELWTPDGDNYVMDGFDGIRSDINEAICIAHNVIC